MTSRVPNLHCSFQIISCLLEISPILEQDCHVVVCRCSLLVVGSKSDFFDVSHSPEGAFRLIELAELVLNHSQCHQQRGETRVVCASGSFPNFKASFKGCSALLQSAGPSLKHAQFGVRLGELQVCFMPRKFQTDLHIALQVWAALLQQALGKQNRPKMGANASNLHVCWLQLLFVRVQSLHEMWHCRVQIGLPKFRLTRSNLCISFCNATANSRRSYSR
mmetsp:Transcript_14996/g.35367  ORF Transcript_14996/g.35367 Transcript_14996/m.35367 type:complete len:220 (-) Transcript_14996:29-688(-)